MIVVVDSGVLSWAYRRRLRPDREAALDAKLTPAERRHKRRAFATVGVFRSLVEAAHDVRIPGVVYQEVLSGIKVASRFDALQATLEPFPVVTATKALHALAARIFNECRAKGVAATHFDCLIAATARGAPGARILTIDADFTHMAKHLGVSLLAIPDGA